ncbi:MAG: beta-1,6-N-acetylglucosaminyltransferase [Sphingomonadales bacterium]
MRIAYFIAAHRNAEQLDGLIGLLSGPDDTVLVHVDAKADPSVHDVVRRRRGQPNLRVLPPRNVHWGGWSLARLMLDALADLCVEGLDWNYLVNLSGQDMPLRPAAEFRSFLARSNGANFIDCRLIDTLPQPLRGVVKRRYHWLRIEFSRGPQRLPVPMAPFHGGRVKFYGSQWAMLSRAFCDWAATATPREAGYATLKFTFAPDELLMQQMIVASPFRDTLVPDNKRYTNFRGAAHPRILTMADLPELDDSGALFARKFEPAVDPKVIAALSARFAG